MRLTFSVLIAAMVASPAFAAGGAFVSLHNTDFVVLLAFILFIGVLFYFKVPSLIGGMLDKRATGIKSELEEARALREEAQTLLASYERKQQEVKDQADRIVTAAKAEAQEAADQARADLEKSIARRVATAQDQIESAQAAAVKEVRDQAIIIAIASAKDVIAKQMTAAEGNALIDAAIADVDSKMH